MKLESFNTILSDCTSKYNKIKKEDYLPEGQFPIIDQGQKFIGGYTDDGGLITDIEKELIIFGDHTKILKFIDFPIAIGADGVKVLHVNKEKADPRYIYYFLRSVKLTDAGYSRHFKFLKEIKIPVPENIDDQIKIARILKHVEILITQRKESINLLDEMLRSTFFEMFGDPINGNKFERKPFKEVSVVRQGLQIPISLRKTEAGENRLPYITNQFINGGKIAEFIENPKQSVICKNDDVLMTRTGNTGIVLTDIEGVFHNNFFLIDYKRDVLIKKYLVGFLQLPQIKKVILKKHQLQLYQI